MFLITIFLLLVVPIFSTTELLTLESINEQIKNNLFTLNNLWIVLSSILVFIMHLGFSMLEAGLTRARNTVNILFKNLIILVIGFLSYYIIGYGLMYPGFGENTILKDILGFSGFGLEKPQDYSGDFSYWADFLFQSMFAATAITILSGAVAERIKLTSFIIVGLLYVTFVYPIVGSWHWGGGWLAQQNFYDFAGSTLVHSLGGWAAVSGVLLLGPRLGKYLPNGVIKPIYPHNIPLAAIGTLLLWFGWFGFNGGSVLSADADSIAYVLVITTLGASAGVIGAVLVSHFVNGKLDLSMALNGALAGLVSITAGTDVLTPLCSLFVGFIGGCLVVFSVLFFDKIKLDDPVGAISVHLTCGIWGTLAVGLFSTNKDHTFSAQLLGVVTIGAFCFISSFLLFYIVKLLMGLRVSKEEELKGLDISEHGMEAYHSFQIFSSE